MSIESDGLSTTSSKPSSVDRRTRSRLSTPKDDYGRRHIIGAPGCPFVLGSVLPILWAIWFVWTNALRTRPSGGGKPSIRPIPATWRSSGLPRWSRHSLRSPSPPWRCATPPLEAPASSSSSPWRRSPPPSTGRYSCSRNSLGLIPPCNSQPCHYRSFFALHSLQEARATFLYPHA